jgi:hypothetical protein
MVSVQRPATEIGALVIPVSSSLEYGVSWTAVKHGPAPGGALTSVVVSSDDVWAAAVNCGVLSARGQAFP